MSLLKDRSLDVAGGIHKTMDDLAEGAVLTYDPNVFISNVLTLLANTYHLKVANATPSSTLIDAYQRAPITLFIKPRFDIDPVTPDVARGGISPWFTNAVQGSVAPFGEANDSIYASLYKAAVQLVTELLVTPVPNTSMLEVVKSAISLSGVGDTANVAGYAMSDTKLRVNTKLTFDPDLWILHSEVKTLKTMIGGKNIDNKGVLVTNSLAGARLKYSEIIGSSAFGMMLLILDWPFIKPDMFAVADSDPVLRGLDPRSDGAKLVRASEIINRFVQFVLTYRYQGLAMSVQMQRPWFARATAGRGGTAARREAIEDLTSFWDTYALHPLAAAVVRMFTNATCKLPTGSGPALLFPGPRQEDNKAELELLLKGKSSDDDPSNFLSRIHPLSQMLVRYHADSLASSASDLMTKRMEALVDATDAWRGRQAAMPHLQEHIRKHLPWGWSLPINGLDLDLTGPNLGITDGRGFTHDPIEAVTGTRFFIPWSLRQAFVADGVRENVPVTAYQVVPVPERLRVYANTSASILRGRPQSYLARFAWFGEPDSMVVTLDTALFELAAVANEPGSDRDTMAPFAQRSLSPRRAAPASTVLDVGRRFAESVPHDSASPWAAASVAAAGCSLALQNWPLNVVESPDSIAAIVNNSPALVAWDVPADRSKEIVMRVGDGSDPFFARVPLAIFNATGRSFYLPIHGDLVLAAEATLPMRRQNEDVSPNPSYAARALSDLVSAWIPAGPAADPNVNFYQQSSAGKQPQRPNRGDAASIPGAADTSTEGETK